MIELTINMNMRLFVPDGNMKENMRDWGNMLFLPDRNMKENVREKMKQEKRINFSLKREEERKTQLRI